MALMHLIEKKFVENYFHRIDFVEKYFITVRISSKIIRRMLNFIEISVSRFELEYNLFLSNTLNVETISSNVAFHRIIFVERSDRRICEEELLIYRSQKL